MRTLKDWLNLYGESHQNETNKLIHKVCVPLIMLSLLGLMTLIPAKMIAPFNFSHVFIGLTLIFYALLKWWLVPLMLLFVAPMLYLNHLVYIKMAASEVLILWVVVFVAAWIGQFVGHKIEGKKPSFLDDLSFLLIGPMWVIKVFLPEPYKSLK